MSRQTIVISENAKTERVNNLFNESVAKIKALAEKGFSSFKLDFLVAEREELNRVLDKLEAEYNLGIAYKGLTFNGYDGDFKSYTIKLC